MKTILQIIPAPNCDAIFQKSTRKTYTPLIGWALTQDHEGNTKVEGLVVKNKKTILYENIATFLR